MTAHTEQTDPAAPAADVDPLPSSAGSHSRRRVLGMAAVVGAAGLAAACGGGSSDTSEGPTSSAPETSEPETSQPESSSPPESDGGGGVKGLVAASAVPVRGGEILDGPKIVVTQPEKGTFKAFTAVCTHMACLVSDVQDNVISCPCHGSRYSAQTGQVEGGPAPAPLAEVKVKVVDGQVVEA